MPWRPALLSASFFLACIILLGKLSGFLREIQIAALFGLSDKADFAVILLTAPDLMVNLLLAGGLSAALIPEFKRLGERDRTSLFTRAAAMVTGMFVFIGCSVAVFPEVLIFPLAPIYMHAGEIPRTAFAVMTIAIPLSALSGVTTALLNSQNRFLIAGAGTLVLNLTLMGALYLSSEHMNLLLALAIAVVVGAALRVVSQLAASRALFRWTNHSSVTSDTKGLAGRFAAAISATTLMLLVPVLIRSAMSFAGEGVIAAFNFATKLVELPLGIAVSSVITVTFTRLSDDMTESRAKAEATFSAATISTVLMSIAIAGPAIWFSDVLTGIVYGWGRMTSDELSRVADLAAIGFITLPALAISGMATAMLNAERKTNVVLRRTLLCLLALPVMLAPGLALASTSVSMLALPGFHGLLAISLASAAKLKLSQTLLFAAGRRLAALTLVFCAAFGADFLLGNIPLFARGLLAIVAIVVAVLVSAIRTPLKLNSLKF